MGKNFNTDLIQSFFEASPLGFAHLEIISYKRKKEIDFRFMDVNPAFEKFTGLKRKSIAGKKLRKIFNGEDSSGNGWQELFEKVAAEKKIYEFEHFVESNGKSFVANAYMTDDSHMTFVLTNISTGKHSQEPGGIKDLQKNAFWDNNILGVIIADKDGNYVDANDEACRMTGYTCDDLKKMNIFGLIDPEQKEEAWNHFEKTRKTGKAFGEYTYFTKSGEERWWNIMATRLSEDFFLGLHEDITSRKLAEQQLCEQKEHHSNVIANIGDILWEYEINSEGKFECSYVSPVADVLLDLPAGTIGNDFDKYFKFIHPDDIKAVRSSILQYLFSEENKIYKIEYRIITGNDNIKYLRSSGIVHLKPNGNRVVYGTTTDITELKTKEEELQKAKANLQSIVENTPDSIWAINRNYDIIYLNENLKQAYLATFNVTLQPGSSKLHTLPEALIPIWKERYDKVLSGERIEFIDKVEVPGISLYIEVAGNPIVQNGTVVGASFFGKDITDRKRTEQLLIENEERFRMLIKNIFAIIVTLNEDGVQQFVSSAAEKITGFTPEELTGKSLAELIHPDDLPTIMKLWSKGICEPNIEHTVEYRHIHKTKGWVHLEAVAQSFLNESAVKSVIAIEYDITERKQADIKLKEEKIRFQHLFEHSPVAIWLEDLTELEKWFNKLRKEGVEDLKIYLQQNPDLLKKTLNLIRIVDVNHAALVQNAASSKEQLIGNLSKLFEDMTFFEYINELEAIWQGKEYYEYESQCKNLKGDITSIIVRYSIPRINGKLDYSNVILTGTDISERKQAEAQLKESEMKFRELSTLMRLMTDNMPDMLWAKTEKWT